MYTLSSAAFAERSDAVADFAATISATTATTADTIASTSVIDMILSVKEPIHRARGLLLHAGYDVRVDRERRLRVAVTEELLNNADGRALSE
jgi:hypothetical protein